MKVELREGYLLVTAPACVRVVGTLVTGSEKTKALALFPFIFIRDRSCDVPWLINHERIHFRQQLETLFIGLPIISLAERLYARFVLKKSKTERYLYAASEQEAYRNQNDAGYLTVRPFGAVFAYIKNKRRFTFGAAPGEVRYLDDSSQSSVG